MKKSILSLIFLISCLTSTSCNVEYVANQYQVGAMYLHDEIVEPLYTYVGLTLYSDKNKQEDEKTINALDAKYQDFSDMIKNVHIKFDRDNSYTDVINIKSVNDAYAKDEVVAVDDDLKSILITGIEMTKLTNGYFNIGMGTIIDAWGDKFDYCGLTNTDISKERLEAALANVPTVEEVSNMLTFTEDGVKFNKVTGKDVVISLGAISKGYAIDYTAKYFDDSNTPALINCGSSSIATIKDNPIRDTWNIGLRLPIVDYFMTKMAFTVSLEGTNYLSTSADNEKNFIKENEDGTKTIRHHILNPYTGYPENYHRQIFLYSTNTSGAVLDALSTALMNVEKIEDIKTMVANVEDYYHSSIEFCIFDDSQTEDMFDIYLTQNLKDSIIDSTMSESIDKVNII